VRTNPTPNDGMHVRARLPRSIPERLTPRKDPRVAPKSIVRVVLWMSGALLAFSAMAVSVYASLPPRWASWRFSRCVPVSASWVMGHFGAVRADLRATINCRHLRLHLFRNTIHVGASYLWATSLLLIPFGDGLCARVHHAFVDAAARRAGPGRASTASRIGARRIRSLGVLVILRPGLATFQPGALLTLVAAFGLAITLIATKKLTRTDSTFAIVFWMMLIQLSARLDRLRSAGS